MTDKEINSAEAQAEEILQAAARAIQTEECPQGEECAVHHRVPDAFKDEDSQYARYITYLGDHVVITEDNQELENPAFLLKLVLGLVKKIDLPPRWETTIFYVGDGTIGDLSEKPSEDRRTSLRYRETHDEWEGLEDTHNIIVSALESGFIDVSKPVEG